MENRTHAIVAICFLIVLAVGAVVIVYWLSSGPGEPLAYRIVTQQSVSGLAPHSRVEFKGIEVGHVTRIHFDPDDPSRVIVDFSVKRGTYVTHATYAVMAMHGLTGGVTLDLKLGEGSAAPLATSASDPAHIPMQQGLLAKLEASATKNLAALHDVLENANKMLGAENRQHLGDALRNIDAATARLVKLEDSLLPVLKRMPRLAESARKSLDASHALLANANALVKQARGPVKQLGTAIGSTQHLVRKLDKQTAPDIDALSRSLMRTSRELKELIRELKAKPQSLIFGPAKPAPGPGEPGFNAHATNGEQP